MTGRFSTNSASRCETSSSIARDKGHPDRREASALRLSADFAARRRDRAPSYAPAGVLSSFAAGRIGRIALVASDVVGITAAALAADHGVDTLKAGRLLGEFRRIVVLAGAEVR